jgi:hypothetical protein
MDLLTILAGIILVVILVGLLYALLRVGFRLLRYLIPNAIFGLIILAGANLVGIGVPIDWITVGFSALAGIPGAILMILLYLIGVPV